MGDRKRKLAKSSVDEVDDQPTKRGRYDNHRNDECDEAIRHQQLDESFFFFKLPGELRNHIYGSLTVGCRVRLCPDFVSYNFNSKAQVMLPHECKNLLQTSRQLRDEVKTYVLHNCPSHIQYDHLHIFRLQYGRHRAEVSCIRKLEIDVTGQHQFYVPSNYLPARHSDVANLIAYFLRPLINEGELQHVVLRDDYDRSGWFCPLDLCINANDIVQYLKQYLSLHTGRAVSVEADAEGSPF